MKALVLGAGSMKGAFQVGAIKAVLENGFEPDMIYGTSVGALNTAFMVNEAGLQVSKRVDINWKQIGRHLMEFWITRITSPHMVGKLRSRVSLGVNTLLSQYEGLLDPTPLHDLVNNQIDRSAMVQSGVACKVGAVSVTTGEIHYASPSEEIFMELLQASYSIPLIMPAIPVGPTGELFLDGALREVIPIRQALQDGAKEVVIIACHAKAMYLREEFNPRNLLNLIQRIKDISVNQLVNNDILWARIYAESANLKGDEIKLTVIRPSLPPSLDLARFTSEDISRLIIEGYREGLKALNGHSEEEG